MHKSESLFNLTTALRVSDVTITHDRNRKQYSVTVTRCCSYSCFCAPEDGWWWRPKHV